MTIWLSPKASYGLGFDRPRNANFSLARSPTVHSKRAERLNAPLANARFYITAAMLHLSPQPTRTWAVANLYSGIPPPSAGAPLEVPSHHATSQVRTVRPSPRATDAYTASRLPSPPSMATSGVGHYFTCADNSSLETQRTNFLLEPGRTWHWSPGLAVMQSEGSSCRW